VSSDDDHVDAAAVGENLTTTTQDDNRPVLYNKAMFILKLKEERRLTQVAIDGLIDDVASLLEEETLTLIKDINHCIQGNVPEHVSNAINAILSCRMVKSPFEGLQSAYLQKQYFINNLHLVVCCYKIIAIRKFRVNSEHNSMYLYKIRTSSTCSGNLYTLLGTCRTKAGSYY